MTGVRIPVKMLWVNFELARELGFPVPPSNTVTPELERALCEALAYRALRHGEDVEGRPTTRLWADLYGGPHLGAALGSGRSALLDQPGLSIKGIGRTPLAPPSPGEDFAHFHGDASFREGMREAIFGEVNQPLFSAGSTRVLALLDTGEKTVWPDGGEEARILVARYGLQARPGHVLTNLSKAGVRTIQAGPFSKGVFVEMARATGHLVEWTDPAGVVRPDLASTQRRLDAAHARTAAEQFRWLLLHGSLTASNMQVDGAQIDLATEAALPRTANAKVLDWNDGFLSETKTRATELARTYRALCASLPPQQRKLLRAADFPLQQELVHEFRNTLNGLLAEAAGLKRSLVSELVQSEPDVVREFGVALYALATLPGEGNTDVQKGPVDDAALVDIFGLLRALPRAYFHGLSEELLPSALEALAPFVSEDPVRRVRNERLVAEGTERALKAYDTLMQTAQVHLGGHYSSTAAFKVSVLGRAAFENRPMTELYFLPLDGEIVAAADAYGAQGDPSTVARVIDTAIAHSQRSVEALLRQGTSRPLEGALELQRRTVDAINYSLIMSLPNARSKLRLTVPVRRTEQGNVLDVGNRSPPLTGEALREVGYKFTLDGWQSFRTVRPVWSEEDSTLTFDIPLRSDVVAADVEGLFALPDGRGFLKRGNDNFLGYSFALPGIGDTEKGTGYFPPG